MNIDILKSKIELISNNIKNLEKIFPKSFDDFQNNEDNKAATERYFQIIVDSMVDCNQKIIEDNNWEEGNTYFKTFGNLLGKSIFNNELLENLSYCVGTRNAIVHRYESIQLMREYEDIKKFMPMFKQYLNIISNKYL